MCQSTFLIHSEVFWWAKDTYPISHQVNFDFVRKKPVDLFGASLVFKDTELLVGKLDDYGANYQDFSYFELYEAPESQIVEAWRRLLRFLGVAAWEVSHGDVVGASDLVETTPYAQAETVLNYEEVAARLAPTAYAHLLH